MKSLLAVSGLFLLSLNASAGTITVESEAVPTCFELANTAVVTAIRDAEAKAAKSCRMPELTHLETQIKAGSCGFVRVVATFHCG
jgi:hypothetical protein